MEYMITGGDGKEYGPVGLGTLQQWQMDGRIKPSTPVRDIFADRVLSASDIPGIFENANPATEQIRPQVETSVAPQSLAQSNANQTGTGPLWGVIARAAAGIILFFAFQGIGLFFCAYGLYHAVQLKQNGNKYGPVAIVIAAAALAAVCVGWYLRVNTGQQ